MVIAPLMPSNPRGVVGYPRDGATAHVLGQLENFTNVNESNLLINFSAKDEISTMRQMELKVLSAVIPL